MKTQIVICSSCVQIQQVKESSDGEHVQVSPCVSRTCRSLSVPSNTLPVSLKRAGSSTSRGNRDSFSHIKTLSRLKDKPGSLSHMLLSIQHRGKVEQMFVCTQDARTLDQKSCALFISQNSWTLEILSALSV